MSICAAWRVILRRLLQPLQDLWEDEINRLFDKFDDEDHA